MSETIHPRVTETFIRVYRLPSKLTDGFCFGGGRPIEFLNVDWFNVPDHMPTPPRADIETFIKAKNYYDPLARFLVLDSRPGETFVIEPMASEVEAIRRELHAREMLKAVAHVQKNYGEED